MELAKEEEVYKFLKEEIIRLKEENEGLQQDRELAGELGKSLLENNHELERKLEEVNNDYISTLGKIEELKQDNHTLRSKLETEIRANSNHVHELDDLKEKLRKEFDEKEKSQQLLTEKKVNDLRKEIESLQNDVSKHTLVENQLQEKSKKQEEMLRKAYQSNEELQHKGRSRLESIEEYVNLTAELQGEREVLMMKLADYEDNQQRMLFDQNVLKEKVGYLEEELQEKTRQAHTWLNCLQDARLEAGELKAELENLKADNARRNFGKQGNSLFGEVEDRRLELEKKYCSLQARHEGMVKIHNMTKQHLQRLKNQVATLLQVKGCHADASQIQRLTQALVQKEGEVKILNAKISSLEKQKAGSSLSDRLMEFHDAFSEFGDKKDYVNFLQLQLEDSKKTVAGLNKELQNKTLLHLAETDRLRHTEHQLHASESKVERLNSENIKLRLKIDDLRIKLQNHSQGIAQNASQPQNINRSVGKARSAAGFTDANTSLEQTAPKKQRQDNLEPKARPIKQEPLGVKPKLDESTSVKFPNVPSILQNMHVPDLEKPAKREENSKLLTPVQAGSIAWNLNSSKNLALSNNSDEKGVRIEEKCEKKTRVHFPETADSLCSTKMDTSDLTQTQSVVENAHMELKKENCHPKNCTSENGSISTVTVKGQRKAPVVINVKKGEAKNQCPQQ